MMNDREKFYADIDIFCINLKARSEKKQIMIDQFKKHNIDVKFYEAIDGRTLDVKMLNDTKIIDIKNSKKFMKRDPTKFPFGLKRGEIGCTLSHIDIILNFLKSPKQYLLIFEDDVILSKNFRNDLFNIIQEVNQVKWNVLYLNENCYRHFGDECQGPQITKSTIRPNNIGYGTYGYILKKNIVKKYADKFLPVIMPIDSFMVEVQKHDKNMVFLRLINPIVLLNKNFQSDTMGIK